MVEYWQAVKQNHRINRETPYNIFVHVLKDERIIFLETGSFILYIYKSD